MNGLIFDIKHFAVHDGPGIRTTVFFKGCPLKCVWCHNPESISRQKQLGFIVHKCVNCGSCVNVCPVNAHSIDQNGAHRFDRQKCVACGKCANVCPADALTLYGTDVEVDAIIDDVITDKDFYESSNGGVTLSGGECLIQAPFCAQLLKRLQQEGIHTAVDTCGFVSKEALDVVMPYTDLFLYDVKAYDEDVHISCTGQSNKIILENLKYIDNSGKSIEIRIPFVPEYNDNQISKISEFLAKLKNVTGVRVLAYHNYSGTKYKSVDMEDTLPQKLPDNEQLDNAKKIIASLGLKVLE